MEKLEFSRTGPLYDGRLETAIGQGYTDALDAIAEQGHADVLARFGEVLRTHPTGRLESNVRVHRTGDDFQIDNGTVVYGPWIEGVGSRNATTRFKGYATFRRVTQLLRDRAAAIASRVIGDRIGRL